jgi:hypothetical protein
MLQFESFDGFSMGQNFLSESKFVDLTPRMTPAAIHDCTLRRMC